MNDVFAQISLAPVGMVRSTITAPQDDIWGGLVSRIDLDPSRFSSQSLIGLPEFSHIQILFQGDVKQPVWATALMAGYFGKHK